MATGNTHENLMKFDRAVFERTDRQTDRMTNTLTYLLQYFATLPGQSNNGLQGQFVLQQADSQ